MGLLRYASNDINILIDFFKNQDVYVVGGTVRDRLIGRATPDIDLVMATDPSNIAEKLGQELGGTSFPLDKERGIIRIALPNGAHVDITKKQGKTFADDLDRRDFTVNALALPLARWSQKNWAKEIIDRHDGLKNLDSKIIRSISKTVFNDDPLRLLRAFRISSQLNFEIEATTLKLIAKHKKELAKPAAERIREELLQIFSTPNAHRTFVAMEKSGLLDIFFPEAKALRKSAPAYYGKGGVLKHTLDSLRFFEDVQQNIKSWFPNVHAHVTAYLNEVVSNHPRHARLKWALLLHDVGKPATAKVIKGRLRFFQHEHVGADMIPAMAKRYRWSNDETSRHARLVRNHMRPGNLATAPVVTDKAIHRFFRDLGDDAVGMLLVSLGDHLSYLTPRQLKKRSSSHEKVTIKMINRFYQTKEKILPPRLLTGHDLMKRFSLKPSPLIGQLLTDLTEAQSEGNVKTKEDALRFIKQKVAAVKS